jgi:hypothetical protein
MESRESDSFRGFLAKGTRHMIWIKGLGENTGASTEDVLLIPSDQAHARRTE